VNNDGGAILEEGSCDLVVRVTDLARSRRSHHTAEISLGHRTLVMRKVLTSNIYSNFRFSRNCWGQHGRIRRSYLSWRENCMTFVSIFDREELETWLTRHLATSTPSHKFVIDR
jgi:hypothetical protein